MEIETGTSKTQEVNETEEDITQVIEYSSLIEENVSISNIETENNEASFEVASKTVGEEVVASENTIETVTISKKNTVERNKLTELPLSKIKSIMKMDPDCHLISKEALFLTTKATELFLQAIGKETLRYTQMGKRKMMVKRDLDNAINNVSSLCFLDGTLEQLCT
ncbi:hypothetical protein Trydic_g18012 [Trypoxylus dichotomus]